MVMSPAGLGPESDFAERGSGAFVNYIPVLSSEKAHRINKSATV
jgi:hypothetical protein